SEVRPPLEVSASYWKPRTPCASIPHLVGDGFGFANGAYLPDSSGPTGNSNYLGAEFRVSNGGEAGKAFGYVVQGRITSRPRYRSNGSKSRSWCDGAWCCSIRYVPISRS